VKSSLRHGKIGRIFVHNQLSYAKMCRQELVLLDNELSFNEAMIEEREQGIKEVQEQIGQANEIFKDLAVLVHEQGVVIGKLPTTQKMSYSCCHPWIFLPLSSFSNIFCYNRRHSIQRRWFRCCNNSSSSSAS
jgi:hypothetical protein